jgi:DNA-binding NtrC family response regulator
MRCRPCTGFPGIVRYTSFCIVSGKEQSDMEKARILLVDDEPVILRMIERELGEWTRLHGHELIAVSSARAALQEIEARGGGIDLLVTDLRMPEMDGMELYAHMEKLWPRIVSLLLTGCFDSQVITQAVFAGFFGYILKPWDQGTLAAEMERALARSDEPDLVAAS